MFSISRNPRPDPYLFRKIALAIATIVLLGTANATPAAAWYDAYGYWHPQHHHNYWRAREEAAERHHWWCERHPYACGYGHRYRYRYDDWDDYRR